MNEFSCTLYFITTCFFTVLYFASYLYLQHKHPCLPRDFLCNLLNPFFHQVLSVLTVLRFSLCLFLQHTTISTLPAGFEPSTIGNNWPQTLVLDSSATGIGWIRTPKHSVFTVFPTPTTLLMLLQAGKQMFQFTGFRLSYYNQNHSRSYLLTFPIPFPFTKQQSV